MQINRGKQDTIWVTRIKTGERYGMRRAEGGNLKEK